MVVGLFVYINTANFGYNDAPLGKKKKVAIREVSLYPKYTNYGNMYTCMYGCRILCLFYMRDMTYHTFVHIYNVIYLRTSGCTVCWRTTLACFHGCMLCHAPSQHDRTSRLMCRVILFDGDA